MAIIPFLFLLTCTTFLVRSGKEFRAYELSPGRPIQGPISYDLALALDESLSDEEGDHDVDLEEDEPYLDSTSCSSAPSSSCCTVPQLSASADEHALSSSAATTYTQLPSSTSHARAPPSASAPSTHAPSAASQQSSLLSTSSLRSYLPRILLPFLSRSDSSEAKVQVLALPDEPEPEATLATGKAARRKRKSRINHDKRNTKRRVEQHALKTALKEVTRRRIAESEALRAGDSFVTEDLPVNKGAWSGLRQVFEKILPDLTAITGEEYKMELVPWNGK